MKTQPVEETPMTLKEAMAEIERLNESSALWGKRYADKVQECDSLQSQIADLREFAYERAPKMAAEELARQKAEFEAQLAEANKLKEELGGHCPLDHAVNMSFAEFVAAGGGKCGVCLQAVLDAWQRYAIQMENDGVRMIRKLRERAEAAEAQLAEAVAKEKAIQRQWLEFAGAADARLNAEREKANARAEAAEALAARLRTALEAVEYHQAYTFSCPWCFNLQENGHKPTCQRQSALSGGTQEDK